MRRAALAALAAFLIPLWLLLAPAAPAAEETLAIRRVDTTAFPEVRLQALYTGEVPDLRSFVVREQGAIVPAERVEIVPLARTATPVGIVLVIDTSGSMEGDNLAQAKDAARRFVAGKAPNDRISVVAFSSEPRVVVNFTDQADLLTSAIDSLTAQGETALWAGVRAAAELLAGHAELLPYMVVLSDGANTIPSGSLHDARQAAVDANASVFAVGLRGGGEFDAAGLTALASATSGRYAETANAGELGNLYDGVQRVLQNQYEITYRSSATEPVTLALSVGGVRDEVSIAPNAVTQGEVAKPRLVAQAGPPSPLGGELGLILAVCLAAAVAAVLGGTGVAALRRPSDELAAVLAPYAGGVKPDAGAGAGSDQDGNRSFVHTAVLRRAVDTTARIARRQGVLEQVERKLDQADLRLRAQEALFFWLVAVGLAGIVAAAFGGVLVGGIALVVGGLLPVAAVTFVAERRQQAFVNQLPDTLELLASSLRAGFSLLQGLDAVAAEVPDPMGRELRRAALETRLGRNMEDALRETAARMGSSDFDWVVLAIGIQREVGGNLAELLSTVSETMVARERLRREVSALTAEGKLSAIVVGAMPVVLAVVLSVLNPGYLSMLFATTLGKAMLLGAVCMAAAGFVWMRKIVNVEV